MKKLTLGLIVVAALVYLVFYSRNGLGALLLFAPFTIAPLAFIAYFVTRWKSLGSQLTCLVGTILYLAWCVYVYVDVTILHPDPQSPIALLFIGIYAAPVLFVLFLIAYAFEWHHQAVRKVGDFAN